MSGRSWGCHHHLPGRQCCLCLWALPEPVTNARRDSVAGGTWPPGGLRTLMGMWWLLFLLTRWWTRSAGTELPVFTREKSMGQAVRWADASSEEQLVAPPSKGTQEGGVRTGAGRGKIRTSSTLDVGAACPPILGVEKFPGGASAWKPPPSSRGRERAGWRPRGTGWSPARGALPLPTPGQAVQIALAPAQLPGIHLAWRQGWGSGAWWPALPAAAAAVQSEGVSGKASSPRRHPCGPARPDRPQ